MPSPPTARVRNFPYPPVVPGDSGCQSETTGRRPPPRPRPAGAGRIGSDGHRRTGDRTTPAAVRAAVPTTRRRGGPRGGKGTVDAGLQLFDRTGRQHTVGSVEEGRRRARADRAGQGGG